MRAFPDKPALEGRDAIARYGREVVDKIFEYSAHMMYNPVIDVDVANDSATGKWYFDVFALQPDGYVDWHHGRYHDEYTKIDGEWLFDSVECSVLVDTEGWLEYDFGYNDGIDLELYNVRFPSV